MTKTELEAFLAVLQYGSISAAAERLFITQPAMSRRMKSMEEELGYSLFERGRGQRSVELTENGKEFVPVADQGQEAQPVPGLFQHFPTLQTPENYVMISCDFVCVHAGCGHMCGESGTKDRNDGRRT